MEAYTKFDVQIANYFNLHPPTFRSRPGS